jgi:hypothetical protein
MPAKKKAAAKRAIKNASSPRLRVLFPLDGSEDSYLGLEKAFGILPPSNVDATLLVVMQNFKGAPPEEIEKFEQDLEDEVFPTEGSALYVMRTATQRLRDMGVRLKFKTARGRVANEILSEVPNHDLLVMHRRAGKRTAAGAARLAKKATGPVLLMNV